MRDGTNNQTLFLTVIRNSIAYGDIRRKQFLGCLVCDVFNTHHEMTASYITYNRVLA